jgi:glycosyltransferase involved in cell wall biosynthesis
LQVVDLSAPTNKPALLCVANWDSNVGYAWWLMESFWLRIHAQFSSDYEVMIAYPSISTLPKPIQDSPIGTVEFDFVVRHPRDLAAHIGFIKAHNIQAIYFSDRPMVHWSYAFFRWAGVKTIAVHDHTPGARTQPKGLRRLIKTVYARLPLLVADVAIGATEYVKQRLIDINCLPADKCHAAPNGLPAVDDSAHAPIDLHQQLGIAPDTPIIVSTGRANLYKGVDFALEVVAQLVHQHKSSNFHFVYCGDGPDLDYLISMARTMAIEHRVTFLGRVNHVEQILRACHIAFHPSRGEVGYSLAILEYMRAGLPVLVSDNPSVCEATRHERDGLIYRENSVDDACEKMTRLLTDAALRSSLGAQGKRAVAEEYSLTATHQALIHALRSAILK